eukprot:3528846-Alexandrium_andersonii.AAC.1
MLLELPSGGRIGGVPSVLGAVSSCVNPSAPTEALGCPSGCPSVLVYLYACISRVVVEHSLLRIPHSQ